MELDWSEHAPHIRTLFRPWQPGEGYSEADIQEEEERLGARVPTLLRDFYLNWGLRHDLTNRCVHLSRPENLSIVSDALIVYTEWGLPEYWSVRRESLAEPNPPIFYGSPKQVRDKSWLLISDVEWKPTFIRLSDLLDDVTYTQAIIGGAVHGGHAMVGEPDKQPPLKEYQRKWLDRHWQQVSIKDVTGSRPSLGRVSQPYYVRDGQLIRWKFYTMVAVRDAAALDEIAWVLQLQWFKRW